MAEIVVGPVAIGGDNYEVVLRRVGANVTVRNQGVTNLNAPAVQNQILPPNENTSGGGKKMKKSKGKSTRKLSGYMKFAQEARPKILAENPEMKSDIIKVGRKIGEMWRGLSPDEKARY
jgi:hypothetical protein